MVLDFIKKLFNKGPEELELKQEDIPNYIIEKAKEAESEMVSFLEGKKQEFEEVIEESRNSIRGLRDAQLKNTNIPTKELDLMEGNRVAYMKKLVILIKGVSFPKKIEDVPSFNETLQAQFMDFTKQSARAHQIVSHFFGDEMEKIRATMNRISVLDNQLADKYKELRIAKIGAIIDDIEKSKNAIVVAGQLKDNLSQKKDEVSKVEQDIISLKKELEEMNESKENKDFTNLTEKVAKTEEDIKNNSHAFLTPFSGIQHALRKYSKAAMKNTEWIDAYLEDPLDALTSDDHLVLIEILASLDENTAKLLNEKKMVRVKKNIEKLNKSFVSEFRNKCRRLEAKKQDYKKRLEEGDIADRIKNKTKELEYLEDKKQLLTTQTDELESKLSKIDTDPMNDTMIERINEALEIKLIVL